MSAVLSTPTAADRTMEARRIADETAKAKSQLEIIERSVREASDAGTQAQNRVETLLVEAGALEEKIRKLSDEETVAFLVHCVNAMKGVVANVEAGKAFLKQVEDKVIAAHATLAAVDTKITALHAQAVRDNEEIERKMKDLGIYEARLRKHFAEHLPGYVITL